MTAGLGDGQAVHEPPLDHHRPVEGVMLAPMLQVEIEADDRLPGMRGLVEIPRIAGYEQVALVTVREPDRCSRHGIVSPGTRLDPPPEVRLRKIVALFPTRQVSLCLPEPHRDGE